MKKCILFLSLLCMVILAFTSTAALAANAGINQDDAWRIAMQDAGAYGLTVKQNDCKLDVENGQTVYELSFVFDNSEYEYTLRADDGMILEKEKELLSMDLDNGADSLIPEEQAGRIALESAGQTASSVSFSKIKLERERGLWVYEIIFLGENNIEYQYEIQAGSGLILKEGYEAWNKMNVGQSLPEKTEYKKQQINPANSTAQPGNGQSSRTQEASISLSEAKLGQSLPEKTENKKQQINSANSTAQPGNSQSSRTQEASISLSEAKSIALNSAGVSGDQVKFSKAKLTRDDGRLIYEIEFYIAGKAEYEYEIDANTGRILDADFDNWDDD